MLQISVIIITFNEERNIARCLESAKSIADEIIVVDSCSTDKTASIAGDAGAQVIQRRFKGYGEQKNFATSQAANDWILSLDADEVLSPELQQSIRDLKDTGYAAYEMPRMTNYCGKWIRHCGWYPDRQTRLYNRLKGKWEEKKVHEYWRPDNGAAKGLLKGDILHYSFTSLDQHLEKIQRYSELAARAATEEGKSASILKILVSPKWHFFSEYFIKLGFLDGFYGYIICRLSAHAAFLKYSKTRLYHKQGK
jgi:glycosyltransferase involved in cell wall biosynthesis